MPTSARRADTLALARAADPIAITEAVMGAFARLAHDCRQAGARPKILDALIASTAIEHGLPVVTQDDDFACMARAHPRLVVEKV
jgi:predicted nucleic acid-binding protein